MADGSMPLSDYDAVDPELAQFDYLPVPNVPEVFSPEHFRLVRATSTAA
jgi:hypothetical protein